MNARRTTEVLVRDDREVETADGRPVGPGRAELDFDAFVLARGAALVRVARALLKDPHDAEDVLQDVLAKAHQHWAHIADRDRPEAYVYRMLVNASTSFWRRGARRELSLPPRAVPVGAGPDEVAVVDERDRVLAALRRLPPKQRAVLVLRHYEALPDAEIARLVGTSVATVRSNAHRGLAKLRVLLADTDPQPAPASPNSGKEGRP